MRTILVIDDEKDARDLLKQYLSEENDYLVLDEANNGFEAVTKINQLKPDLIFLDIQMPGLNGFEVLERLEYLPQIVFSTAYDNYVMDAFQVQAIDYLLKPYGKKRFQKAIDSVSLYNEKIALFAQNLINQKNTFIEKIILNKGNKKIICKVSDIFFIEAFGDYSKVHFKNETLLALTGISEMETKCNPKQFTRIHRSFIVNLNFSKEIIKKERNYCVLLANNKLVKISETYLPSIKSKFL